jgi:23S rRNA pseudouridine1911/1915/1917 synthase
MRGNGSVRTGVLGEGRLDSALAAALPEISRARIQALFAEGAIIIGDDAPSTLSSRKYAGRQFTLSIPEMRALDAQAQNIALNIVHEDEDLVIVDKPAGLVVHPAAGHADGTLVNALLHHCKGRLSGIGGVERPGIVHRIDKDTSGLMVVAKSDRAHEGLAKLFAAHELDRRYLAVVRGVPIPPAGTVHTQIGRSTINRKKMAVLPEGKGKHATTHYRMIDSFGDAALVECTLETGRTHQVRVHMTHLGHPLIGDSTYNNRQKSFKNRPVTPYINRQALHAAVLGFKHPVSGELLRFESALPEDIQHLLSALRL